MPPPQQPTAASAPEASGAAAAGGACSSALAIALHPVSAFAVALGVGASYDQVYLSAGCCLLGLGAGAVISAIGSRFSGAAAEPAPPEPALEVPQSPDLDTRATPLPTRQPSNPLAAIALDEIVKGLELLDSNLNADERAARGWKQHSVSDGVTVFTNPRPTGETWGMGMGQIPQPVERCAAEMDSVKHRSTLDKQWLSTETLLELDPASLAWKDWKTEQLAVEHSRYKSPAWPVGAPLLLLPPAPPHILDPPPPAPPPHRLGH